MASFLLLNIFMAMKDEAYFYDRIPQLLSQLSENSVPEFGIMTPQHMIEHLIVVTKSSIKLKGAPTGELSKGQQGFMRFVEKGANFKYRPSEKTVDDLPQLRYGSLDLAKSALPEAIDRLKVSLNDMKQGENYYNPMMGVLSADGMELFHRKHFEWHLEEQYKLS